MDHLYKILLVDDEDEVRGRLLSKINDNCGFTVVGTAGNGHDALELIESLNPHVVLTDIKMPFIDGIELAKIIKSDYPTIKVAFITGYDEFDFAREAIEQNVISYLTKPLTQEDISIFLQNLKVEIDKEYKEVQDYKLMEEQYRESLPLLMDNYFISALLSLGDGKSISKNNLNLYGISLDDFPYLLSSITIESGSLSSDLLEIEKIKTSLRALICSILGLKSFQFYSFVFGDGLIFIVKDSKKHFLKDLDRAYSEILQRAERFLKIKLNVGISLFHRSFSQLNLAYNEANKSLSYSKLLNVGRVVYLSEIEERRPQILHLSENEIKQIEYSLKFESSKDLVLILDKIKETILRDNDQITNFKPLIINIMNLIVNFASTLEIDMTKLVGHDLFAKMNEFSSLEHFFDWMNSTLIELQKMSREKNISNSQILMDKALDYLASHYANPKISMELLSHALSISISYLSLLFKKHLKTTFVKYLTSLRMEKAKNLLLFSGDRIVEISEKCGYGDVYYFSHCFKKQMGISPKKYRDEKSTS